MESPDEGTQVHCVVEKVETVAVGGLCKGTHLDRNTESPKRSRSLDAVMTLITSAARV